MPNFLLFFESIQKPSSGCINCQIELKFLFLYLKKSSSKVFYFWDIERPDRYNRTNPEKQLQEMNKTNL